jgi:hypothetical protein
MRNRIAVLFFFSHNFPTTEAIKKGNKKKAGKIADLFLITTLPREWNLF